MLLMGMGEIKISLLIRGIISGFFYYSYRVIVNLVHGL
jgi:hypothetical protein